MADGWEAFTTAPAAPAPAAVVAAPSSPDGWAAFTAPAAAPEAPASFPVVAPRFLEPHEPGYKPGSMTNMSPEDWAKFSAGEAPTAAAVQSTAEPAPAVPAAPGGKTGIVANLGAGGNAAVAGTLGLPVDLVTGGINLATRGINAATGTSIPQITDPAGGSGTFKRAMGVVGANPDDVRPDGLAQEVARGVGGGVVSSLIPTGAVSGLVRGGVMAAETAPRVLSALGGATAPNIALGATSGAASEAAASQVPDAYKPIVGMGAGLGAVAIPAGLVAGGRAAVNALTDYAAPAVGRAAPVLDASGAVITDANGAPINMLSNVADPSRAPGPVAATPNQARMAGQRLNALASNPDAVQARLAQQGPPAMGDNPTTAQLTADPGLLAAERGLSRTVPGAQREFIKQAGQANDARVQGLQGVAEGGIPTKASDLIQRQASDADLAAAQRMAALRAQTAADVARTEASGQQHAAGLQQGADQAREAVGGNLPAGSEAQVGGALRAPLDAANRAAKARETALWEAIDPDGTLAVDMTPIKKGAAKILKEMSPNSAPLAGEEAAIFETAKKLPSVQSFRDLAALRGRLTDAIRQERGPAGSPQAVRRMSMLLDDVNKAMEGSLESHMPAVQENGIVSPEEVGTKWLTEERNRWQAEKVNAAKSERTSVGQGVYGGNDTGGPGVVPPVVRGKRENPGQSGDAAATQGLQSQPLTANFDEAARARYDAARQATATRKDTFNTPPGVKEAMQGGPTSGSFRLPDSSVPATIIRTGPEGAPRVKAYLAAGGSPEALSEAAAFSLRNYAKRADGTIDPAKYATWAKDRASFLSALPDAAGRFGAAAEAQRAADTGAANAAQTLKDAVKTAQQAVDDAVAAQADRVRDYQRSALGKFVPGSDPVAVVSSILRDPKMGRANMAQVVNAVKADPDALEGLQRAVVDHILGQLKGNSVVAGGTEAALKSDQFQTFLRTREPALREVLTDQQIATLQRTADSLQRSNLSVAGSKLAGGSDTEQIRNAGAHATTLMGRFTSHVTSNIGTGIGGAIGFVFGGGPLGAMAGAGAGKTGDWAAQSLRAAREAGMHTVDDLVANAVLHPQLAAALLAKVTPENEAHLMRAFLSQLQRISLVSTAVGSQRQGMPQPPKNGLLH